MLYSELQSLIKDKTLQELELMSEEAVFKSSRSYGHYHNLIQNLRVASDLACRPFDPDTQQWASEAIEVEDNKLLQKAAEIFSMDARVLRDIAKDIVNKITAQLPQAAKDRDYFHTINESLSDIRRHNKVEREAAGYAYIGRNPPTNPQRFDPSGVQQLRPLPKDLPLKTTEYLCDLSNLQVPSAPEAARAMLADMVTRFFEINGARNQKMLMVGEMESVMDLEAKTPKSGGKSFLEQRLPGQNNPQALVDGSQQKYRSEAENLGAAYQELKGIIRETAQLLPVYKETGFASRLAEKSSISKPSGMVAMKGTNSVLIAYEQGKVYMPAAHILASGTTLATDITKNGCSWKALTPDEAGAKALPGSHNLWAEIDLRRPGGEITPEQMEKEKTLFSALKLVGAQLDSPGTNNSISGR